jgi:flagellar biosynthesis/type III secretory pathway protein FliH
MGKELESYEHNKPFVDWYEANLKPVYGAILPDEFGSIRYYSFLAFVAGQKNGQTPAENDEYDRGYDDGYDDGYDGGFDNGYDDGYDDGFDNGYCAGRSEAEEAD